jgi:hypothetical protein
MKSFGSLYVDTIKLKHPVRPMFEWGWSQETEEPYRESATCLVFWVPFVPRGLAIGIWGKPVHEDKALAKAVKNFDRAPEPDEISEWRKVGEDEDF